MKTAKVKGLAGKAKGDIVFLEQICEITPDEAAVLDNLYLKNGGNRKWTISEVVKRGDEYAKNEGEGYAKRVRNQMETDWKEKLAEQLPVTLRTNGQLNYVARANGSRPIEESSELFPQTSRERIHVLLSLLSACAVKPHLKK